MLRNVLLNLAVRTRSKPGIEEITPNEINEAFYEVSGHTPLDEAAVMLQRLPYLGRVGSGNPNRAFIDGYAKSGLRGIALADAIRDNDKKIPAQKWQQPLGDFGARVLAGKVHKFSDARKYAKLCSSHGNGQVVGDVMCAELEEGRDAHDFSSMRISGVVASTWDFSGKKVVGLVADTCQVGLVELEDSEFADCSFVNSDFQRVSGVASAVAMPTSFKNSCEYSSFTDIDSSARISSLKISPQHKTLLVIIQKLFFQRGKARQEQSLLRGSSAFWDAKAADIAIRYMLKNEIIREAPGKAGKLYGPQLSHKNRMRKLKDGMSTSGDELWNLVAKP